MLIRVSLSLFSLINEGETIPSLPMIDFRGVLFLSRLYLELFICLFVLAVLIVFISTFFLII